MSYCSSSSSSVALLFRGRSKVFHRHDHVPLGCHSHIVAIWTAYHIHNFQHNQCWKVQRLQSEANLGDAITNQANVGVQTKQIFESIDTVFIKIEIKWQWIRVQLCELEKDQRREGFRANCAVQKECQVKSSCAIQMESMKYYCFASERDMDEQD